MTVRHLSDLEIQQFLLHETALYSNAREHLRLCEHCRARSETYSQLFAGIGQQEKPAFDFDLSAMVLGQLPEPAAKSTLSRSFAGFFIMVTAAVIGIAGYLFSKNLLAIFAGVSTTALYLILVSACILTGFQTADMYRHYKRQLKVLNLT